MSRVGGPAELADWIATARIPIGVKVPVLMPWIVSECAACEAMETGLITIPRPPVRIDAGVDPASFKNLYAAVRDRVGVGSTRGKKKTGLRDNPAAWNHVHQALPRGGSVRPRPRSVRRDRPWAWLPSVPVLARRFP